MCRISSILLAAFGVIVGASPAFAGSTYRFEDEQGVVHFTNVPNDPRYQFLRRDPTPDGAGGARGRPGAGGRVGAFGELIRSAASRHGVDQRLVEAVIQVESAGDPGAISPKGAQGLMQLMPERAALLGVRNAFDPAQNINGGVRHLRDLLDRFAGDVTLALAAYNAGEAAVRSHGGVPPYAETREYVRRIRALYDGAITLARRPVALLSPPQRVYQQVDEDGTVTFTNIPPRRGNASSGRF